jgi:hypothetical protein
MWFSLVLISTSSYILFKDKELCLNEPIINEEFVLALDTASWKNNVSQVQVILRLFVLNFRSEQTCLATPENYLK